MYPVGKAQRQWAVVYDAYATIDDGRFFHRDSRDDTAAAHILQGHVGKVECYAVVRQSCRHRLRMDLDLPNPHASCQRIYIYLVSYGDGVSDEGSRDDSPKPFYRKSPIYR